MNAAGSQAGALRLWAPLLAGALAALGALQWAAGRVAFDPDTAGLAPSTRTVLGEADGRPVHCQALRKGDPCLAAYRAAGAPPAVLWLGNSQLHSINRYGAGQQPASALLHRALAAKGRYLVTYSVPNVNLAEQRAMFEALSRPYHVRTLVLAVCLDDFRESGLRPGFGGPRPAGETAFSPQPLAERRLERALTARWDLWAKRPRLRAFSDYLAYAARNRLMGIDARTKRPVPPALYRQKMETLRRLLAEARAAGVRVVVYAPPYRRDIDGPYVERQYAAFIGELKGLARDGEVRVLDLTDLVPGPQWGMLRQPAFGRADYDFMHFTAEGHRLLAGALEPEL